MTTTAPEPCPVCQRIDGGHDQPTHDMVSKGRRPEPQYPMPGDSPTGEQQ